MSRRNQLTLLAAALVTALAACHPSTPTTSVSALSYGFQSAGQHSTETVASVPACATSAQPASRTPTPAEISPNDPLRLFDIP